MFAGVELILDKLGDRFRFGVRIAQRLGRAPVQGLAIISLDSAWRAEISPTIRATPARSRGLSEITL